MIAADTLLKMTMTESFATLVSRFLLYKVLIQMNALFIWGLSQNLFTFFTNGICCFTTTPFKTYQELHGIFKQTVATIQQLAFANFIQSGNWERHLNRSRTLYKRKHHALVKSIMKEMGANVQILGEQSGLHIVLCVHNGMNENELIESAKNKALNYTHFLHMIS